MWLLWPKDVAVFDLAMRWLLTESLCTAARVRRFVTCNLLRLEAAWIANHLFTPDSVELYNISCAYFLRSFPFIVYVCVFSRTVGCFVVIVVDACGAPLAEL